MSLQEQYNKEIAKKLAQRLGVKNTFAVPKITKIMVNSSHRDFLTDKKNLEKMREDIITITGQMPKTALAKLSVATFKLRENDPIGLVVTLRGRRMYDFFEKLVKIVLPRVRDFSGVDAKALDGHGSLSIGFNEHIVFPEIDTGKIDKVRSLQITIVTTAKNNESARALFEEMGMKFKK